MMALVKKIGDKKAAFQIPTVEEVKEYMAERKDWPVKFIEYYSEKFWCHYQSNGWKVSGKAAMKDWKAAFVSQWQRPKFKEDIDFLNECLKEKKPAIVKEMNGEEKLNVLLSRYKQKFESVPDETLVKAYDYMKERGLIQLPKEDVRLLRASYGDNIEKGKAACVKLIFSKMINYGETFK